MCQCLTVLYIFCNNVLRSIRCLHWVNPSQSIRHVFFCCFFLLMHQSIKYSSCPVHDLYNFPPISPAHICYLWKLRDLGQNVKLSSIGVRTSLIFFLSSNILLSLPLLTNDASSPMPQCCWRSNVKKPHWKCLQTNQILRYLKPKIWWFNTL